MTSIFLRKQLRKIKTSVSDLCDKFSVFYSRKSEIRKFKDSRRKNIYSNVQLTEQQCREIDKFYLENYGKKIPHTWHRHYTAFTGNFDAAYFPELLYIPEFERYMCRHREYAAVFTDKNMIPMLAEAAKIKTPVCCFSVVKGVCRNSGNRFITYEELLNNTADIGEVFIKPTVDTSSGAGCLVADFQNGIDTLSGKTNNDILRRMGNDYVIQKRLHCHSSIKTIYDGSVNTFRIISYRWKNEIRVLPAILRIGSGGAYLDNAHAGGMFIAVNNDGTLHKTAFTEFRQTYTDHPDSHLVFEHYKIDLFPKVPEAAKQLHEMLPQIGCVNWDFTIDTAGDVVLIEANINNGKHGGSIWLLEMAHGCGAFGEHTAEILQWLRLMNKTPKSRQHHYEFGKMQ